MPHRLVPDATGPSISNKPATYLQPVGADKAAPAWHVIEPWPHAPLE
jgi:hypothetical protein